MIYVLTLLIAATRFLPHPPNFACLGALGLFAGCYFAGRKAFFVPALALLLSDVIGHWAGIPGMGFYNPMVMAATYLGVTLSVPVGRWLQSGALKWKVPAGALVASTLFFLISNLGVWMGPWYPTSMSGLLACFTNAIPFYGYTLAGNVIFASIMFGAYEFSRSVKTVSSPATATA